MKNISEMVTSKVVKPAGWLGLGLVVVGLIAIFAPRQTGMTIGVVVGSLLIISGIFRMAFAWVAMSWGDTILRFLFGLLAAIAGGIMLADPEVGLRVITVVAIVYLIVDGISAVVFAIRLPPASGSGWIILSGVFSIILGILIWREWPLSGDETIGVLVGIKLIIDGASLLAVAFAARAAGGLIRQR